MSKDVRGPHVRCLRKGIGEWWRWSTLLPCVAMLAACTSPLTPINTHELKSQFDAQLTAQLNEIGPARVQGSASAQAPGGAIVSCAGAPAVLVPVTDYATERFNAIYGSAPGDGQIRMLNGKIAAQKPVKFSPDLPEYKTFSRETVCDASGRFEFLNVRNGLYYLFTMVVWNEHPFDGLLFATRLAVRDGKMTQIALSDH